MSGDAFILCVNDHIQRRCSPSSFSQRPRPTARSRPTTLTSPEESPSGGITKPLAQLVGPGLVACALLSSPPFSYLCLPPPPFLVSSSFVPQVCNVAEISQFNVLRTAVSGDCLVAVCLDIKKLILLAFSPKYGSGMINEANPITTPQHFHYSASSTWGNCF